VIGIDLVDAAELGAARTRERVFTAAELETSTRAGLASAFAAKEALLKALGWGIEQGLDRFAEIEVRREEDGGLALRTCGRTQRELESRGLRPIGVCFALGAVQGAVVLLSGHGGRPPAELVAAVSELTRRCG
jgi:phosphopantetheine--protein transferase-like protein